MLKKAIRYTDFNGDEQIEDFFFHLNQAEIIELEVAHEGGLSGWLTRVVGSNNGAEIMTEFKKLLLMAYGVKSADGKRFVKTDKLREEFVSSEAFSALFMELLIDAEEAAAFVNGIIPANLEADVAKIAERNLKGAGGFQPKQGFQPKTVVVEATGKKLEDNSVVPRQISYAEAAEMDSEELKNKLLNGEVFVQ